MAHPTPHDLVNRLLRSEVAHCVYQAASRGSCRVIRDGKALPMRLYLIAQDVALQGLIAKVMPGVRWSYRDPVHLAKANATGKQLQLLGQIITYLDGMPSEVERVKSSEIKAALTLERDSDDKAFTRAGELLDLNDHGWVRRGRTFMRGATAYGFTVEEGYTAPA
jgi:hypothetical protein